LQHISKKELKYRLPFIIVITVNTSIKAHSIARKFGADYVFTKTKIDYSPRLVIDFAYNYFLTAEDVIKIPTSNKYEDEAKKIIVIYLEKIGITNTLDG